MSKKITKTKEAQEGSFVDKIPKEEKVVLSYLKKDMKYIITQNNLLPIYYLYEIKKDKIKYLKERTGDPLFKECYPKN